MSTKADYTEEEWQRLQWAVANTMAYMSLADPGIWDSFKEATAAVKYISDRKTSADNLLVRDLAGDIKVKRDKEMSGNPTDLAGELASRLSGAASLVAQKDPEDLPAFKDFIIGLAEATAEAVKGVADNESAALDNVRGALG